MFDTSIGETTLVVNSSAAARDLFDKRAAIYSSRPPNPFIFDMLSNGCAATHLPMGDRFRHYRKVMAQALKPSILQDQREGVYGEIVSFLAKLQEGPEDTWCRENQVLAASLGSLIVSGRCSYCRNLLTISDFHQTYGRRIESPEDAMLKEMRMLNEAFFGLIHSLDSPLLRQFPLLARLPLRLFRFQRIALGHADRESAFFMSILDEARRANQDGSLAPCGARNFFDEEDQSQLTLQEVSYAFGSLYGASVDPPKILLDTIGLALMTHPEVMHKAQAELDERYQQTNALPSFSDLPSLAYCRAIFLEALRWRTIAPVGLPHSTTVTDVYRGWTIPKDCVVVGNAYAMHNDPAVWNEPEVSD
jgi:cytochrome P450